MTSANAGEIALAGCTFAGDASGALYWPQERMLVVSDLHFEKGSSFARHGVFLPPYDTVATIEKLSTVIARYTPRTVVALGDSFHDADGAQRLCAGDRAALLALQAGRDWIWIAGNHDPDPSAGIGGTFCETFVCGRMAFRHEPSPETANEIAGHLHPMARISARGRSLSRKCFVTDGRRLIMPAFGAFTGGVNIRSAAFSALFLAFDYTAHMLGNSRLYAFPAAQCAPD